MLVAIFMKMQNVMDLNQNTVVHWIVLAEIASAKVLIFVLVLLLALAVASALQKIETSNEEYPRGATSGLMRSPFFG